MRVRFFPYSKSGFTNPIKSNQSHVNSLSASRFDICFTFLGEYIWEEYYRKLYFYVEYLLFDKMPKNSFLNLRMIYTYCEYTV